MLANRLVLASLLLAILSFAPVPAGAFACIPSCDEKVRVEPCVGAFAEGVSSEITDWTLTYYFPGGSTSTESRGQRPPPAALSAVCVIPGCYDARLQNGLGLDLWAGRQCLE